MSGLLNQCESAVVLLPHSLLGSEVGARIAFRIGCPVVMNCESILLSGGEVVTSRACFGGRLKEDVRVQAPHTVVTVAANASLPPAPGDAYGQGDCWKVEELDFALPDGPGLIECVRRELDAEPLGPSLETACDLGWCPKSWQIGLSGRSIRADWYITFGISGASHHMAGCAQAGKLVAINNDKSAEIFRHATYGVVADARSVLQELVRLFESVEAAVQSCRAG